MKCLPIKSWCRELERGAMEQAIDLAFHPRTFKHVALMPDAHQGYGMPIGGVIAVEDAVIPNAVGVDIGCGMMAVKTSIRLAESNGTFNTEIEMRRPTLRSVVRDIRKRVPVGFNRHKTAQGWIGFEIMPALDVLIEGRKAAETSLGTLGGGNHFIEIQLDDSGHVWIMVHSGSRHLGKLVCDHYNKVAVERCYSEFADYGGMLDSLAYLDTSTDDAREYISCMDFALDFAMENRRRIMQQAMYCVAQHFPQTTFDDPINIHHNFASYETHFGRRVWVHRKGATQATTGQLGIIPGSMGTNSYIVCGLGNKESFMSCSHGAGRRMGRMDACRRISVEDADASMAGIVYDRWDVVRRGKMSGKPDLGEAPAAYKNIDSVIESQLDLVEPVVKLRPLAVVKG